jgi:hypothetical protein
MRRADHPAVGRHRRFPVPLVLLLIVAGIILLVLGLALKALKWLIIVAVVVWVVAAVRGFLARRSSSRV